MDELIIIHWENTKQFGVLVAPEQVNMVHKRIGELEKYVSEHKAEYGVDDLARELSLQGMRLVKLSGKSRRYDMLA